MSSKTALSAALVVVLLLALWPTANLLAQNTCPSCSEPAKVVHPNGFGPESYARWIPKVGELDSNLKSNFAMLLVHLTSPLVTTAARAVVAVEGFGGENPDGFILAYDHPGPTAFTGGKYSTCTGGGPMGNPRWSVRYQVPGTTVDNRFQFGCGDTAMTSSDGIIIGTVTASPNEATTPEPTTPATGWVRQAILLTVNPVAVVVAGGSDSTVIIVSLSILWDYPCAPTPGMCPGSVLVDNITVAPPGGTVFTWTSPADNGSNM